MKHDECLILSNWERDQRESSDRLKSKISQPALIRVLSFWSLPFTKLFWSKKRENKHLDSNRRFTQDIDLKAREQFERENKREKNSPFDFSVNAKWERENAREKSEGSCYVFSSICFYFFKLTPWPVTGITLRINKWSGLKQIKSMVKIYQGTVPTKKNSGYHRMTPKLSVGLSNQMLKTINEINDFSK